MVEFSRQKVVLNDCGKPNDVQIKSIEYIKGDATDDKA